MLDTINPEIINILDSHGYKITIQNAFQGYEWVLEKKESFSEELSEFVTYKYVTSANNPSFMSSFWTAFYNIPIQDRPYLGGIPINNKG